MISSPYKTLDSVRSMPHRPGPARIDIWEIGPTVLTLLRFIVDNKIIPKGGPIIFVHPYGKFGLEGRKFATS